MERRLAAILLVDLATDRTAHYGPANRAQGAAVGQDRSANGANAGTNCRIPVLCRHAGTARQRRTCRNDQCPRFDSSSRFHDDPLYIGFLRLRCRQLVMPTAMPILFLALP